MDIFEKGKSFNPALVFPNEQNKLNSNSWKNHKKKRFKTMLPITLEFLVWYSIILPVLKIERQILFYIKEADLFLVLVFLVLMGLF